LKYSVFMYENEKMRSAEIIPGIGKIKENG
jgi:hypothetical protein